GREVVVKVQRPGVRQQVEVDIGVLQEMAQLATRVSALARRYGVIQMVRELEYSLDQELDFHQEAENTLLIGRQIGEFKRLTTPEVHLDATTRRVLTLGFIRGRRLAEVPREELARHDTRAIARDLLTAYLKQMVVDGAFHCDPHPGNILLS